MKKLLLQILFLLLIIPAMSQGVVFISGTITDIPTGNPIPNHAVTISNDSSSGWFYYNTVYTDNNGFYVDTVITAVPSSNPGTLYVTTIDCQNYPHQQIITYNPSTFYFTADFAICNFNNPCQANFTAQQQQPLTVQFTDASTGGGTERQWMFGDGSTSNDLNPLHTYATAGHYAVTLSIGALGTICYQTVTQNIYVWDSTGGGGCNAAFIVFQDSLNTPPLTYNFVNQSSGNNISTYTWNFGDGYSQTITSPGNPNVVHTYFHPGTYVPCLTIQGNDSTCYDTSCDTLSVGTGGGCHAAFVAFPDSTNTNQSYQFFDQSSGSITSWTWDFGDGTPPLVIIFPANPNVIHTYSQQGNYNVCLTIQGADSTCFDVSCQTITVGPGPGCQANFSYTITPVGGRTISFTDLSTGNPLAWQWNFGDGTSSNLQNPVHVFAGSAPTYTVCLTIAGNNCTSTACKEVVILDSVNYHQVYGQVFAGNFPVSMATVMIFSLDTNANYQPFVAVSQIDSNGVYYFTMVPDGNYYILAIPFDSNGYLPTYYGNTISWEQATLITLGTANNPYDINLLPLYQMMPGPGSASGQINIGDMPASMMDKINMIMWDLTGKAIGFAQVSATGAFIFPNMAYGIYFVHAEMPGVTSDYIKVAITPEKPFAEIVMTFTGNKILGIRDEAAFVNGWSVYPNPVSDHLSIGIDMKMATKAEVVIYNMTGRIVLNNQVTLDAGTNNIGVSTTSLPAGVYTLRISSKEGLMLTTKLIKTR